MANNRPKSTLAGLRMPVPVSVLGRSSTITNAFISGVVPSRFPTEEDFVEALDILGLSADDPSCAYCGDSATELDHFRPLIHGKEPTGYIAEIQNLVPSCGKCNQSKGNKYWRDWMAGSARRCPSARGISDVAERIERLERFEKWREPTNLKIPEIVGPELWEEYSERRRQLLDKMREIDALANRVKVKLLAALRT